MNSNISKITQQLYDFKGINALKKVRIVTVDTKYAVGKYQRIDGATTNLVDMKVDIDTSDNNPYYWLFQFFKNEFFSVPPFYASEDIKKISNKVHYTNMGTYKQKIKATNKIRYAEFWDNRNLPKTEFNTKFEKEFETAWSQYLKYNDTVCNLTFKQISFETNSVEFDGYKVALSYFLQYKIDSSTGDLVFSLYVDGFKSLNYITNIDDFISNFIRVLVLIESNCKKNIITDNANTKDNLTILKNIIQCLQQEHNLTMKANNTNPAKPYSFSYSCYDNDVEGGSEDRYYGHKDSKYSSLTLQENGISVYCHFIHESMHGGYSTEEHEEKELCNEVIPYSKLKAGDETQMYNNVRSFCNWFMRKCRPNYC